MSTIKQDQPLGGTVPAAASGEDDFGAEHAARVAAESNVFMRDRVLSIVSHDLRGPLNAIHSWAHVLERKLASEDPGIARAIAGIRTGVDQQVKLIEDVIDRTRSATRNLVLNVTRVEVAPLIDVELQHVRHTLGRTRGVEVRTQLDIEGVQATLDAERVAQAVWALLAFAIESTQLDDAAQSGLTHVDLQAHHVGKKLEIAVIFTPCTAGRASTALGRRDSVFADAPAELDQGKLALALPTRVAAAHEGEISDEILVDERRRITLHLPLTSSPA